MKHRVLFAIALLAAGSLQAQDPRVMAEQIAKLEFQVAALESAMKELQARLSGLTYSSGSYILNAGAGSITLRGNAVNLEGTTALNLTSGKTIGVTAGTNTSMTSGSALSISTGANTTIQTGLQFSLRSGKESIIESDRPLTIKALGIALQSTSYLTMSGKPVTIESTGDITIQSAARLQLKGTSISQN